MVTTTPPPPPIAVMRWQLQIEQSAAKHGLDPAFVAAVMDRETGGQNIVGDSGHGRGLMQIDDRYHGDWLRAHAEGMDPASNIDYGCSILAAALHQATRAKLEGDDALRFAADAYNAGLNGALIGQGHGDPDERTTGHNYGSDVLRRMREKFQHAPWRRGGES